RPRGGEHARLGVRPTPAGPARRARDDQARARPAPPPRRGLNVLRGPVRPRRLLARHPLPRGRAAPGAAGRSAAAPPRPRPRAGARRRRQRGHRPLTRPWSPAGRAGGTGVAAQPLPLGCDDRPSRGRAAARRASPPPAATADADLRDPHHRAARCPARVRRRVGAGDPLPLRPAVQLPRADRRRIAQRAVPARQRAAGPLRGAHRQRLQRARPERAGRTAGGLAQYGIVISQEANYGGSFEGVANIVSGARGLQAAYTVAQLIPGSTVTLDGREDATIDVVLGGAFSEIPEPESNPVDPE